MMFHVFLLFRTHGKKGHLCKNDNRHCHSYFVKSLILKISLQVIILEPSEILIDFKIQITFQFIAAFLLVWLHFKGIVLSASFTMSKLIAIKTCRAY